MSGNYTRVSWSFRRSSPALASSAGTPARTDGVQKSQCDHNGPTPGNQPKLWVEPTTGEVGAIRYMFVGHLFSDPTGCRAPQSRRVPGLLASDPRIQRVLRPLPPPLMHVLPTELGSSSVTQPRLAVIIPCNAGCTSLIVVSLKPTVHTAKTQRANAVQHSTNDPLRCPSRPPLRRLNSARHRRPAIAPVGFFRALSPTGLWTVDEGVKRVFVQGVQK